MGSGANDPNRSFESISYCGSEAGSRRDRDASSLKKTPNHKNNYTDKRDHRHRPKRKSIAFTRAAFVCLPALHTLPIDKEGQQTIKLRSKAALNSIVKLSYQDRGARPPLPASRVKST